jgi:hypothetical protein
LSRLPADTARGLPAQAWDERKKAWSLLKGLRPSAIELERIALIRRAEPELLMRPGVLEALMLDLGLNDEGMSELPAHLHPHCGPGLRVWQYPLQFAPYLRHLASLQVRSYLEIGIRHGGSYVVTVEVLDRIRPLDWAVGVDIIPCPSIERYTDLNPRSQFAGLNSQSPAFAALRDRLAPIDLVFIDSHHEEEHCRREVAALRPVANMIALHDVSNVGCPGVRTVWDELRATGEYDCIAFTDQYEDITRNGMGPFMGIGLAVRKSRTQAVS